MRKMKAFGNTVFNEKGQATGDGKPLFAVAHPTHGLIPVEYKVVVRPVEEKGYVEFASGFKLHKPDDVKERDQHAAVEGELVAMSPLAFTYEQWPEGARKPVVGDTVVFARYSGNTIKGSDDVEYRVMNDKDIIAIRGGVR